MSHGFKSLEETQQDIGSLQQELVALDRFKQEKATEKTKIEEVMAALLKQKDDLIRQKEAVLFELGEKQRALVAENTRLDGTLTLARAEIKALRVEQEKIIADRGEIDSFIVEKEANLARKEKEFIAKTVELAEKGKEIRKEMETLEDKKAFVESLKVQSEQERNKADKAINELYLMTKAMEETQKKIDKNKEFLNLKDEQLRLAEQSFVIKNDELINRFNKLEVKRTELDQRADLINKKEAELAVREKNIQDRETGITAQEREVRIREGLCSERERLGILKAKGVNL